MAVGFAPFTAWKHINPPNTLCCFVASFSLLLSMLQRLGRFSFTMRFTDSCSWERSDNEEQTGAAACLTPSTLQQSDVFMAASHVSSLRTFAEPALSVRTVAMTSQLVDVELVVFYSAVPAEVERLPG